MAARGVHFALTDAQQTDLLSLRSDEQRIEYVVRNIEEIWDDENLVETDKAWDGIHRSLCESSPGIPFDEVNHYGAYPLKLCIHGGRKILDDEGSYIIRLIEASEVADLAKALKDFTEEGFAKRYWTHCKDAWPEFGQEDLEYTWEYFVGLRGFFLATALKNRSVIFTADQ